MAILGDFGEFEGPVPEPPYPYHHVYILLQPLQAKASPKTKKTHFVQIEGLIA